MNNTHFNIFDESKESYIIGDLLNMPYFFAEWNKTPHHNDYIIIYLKKLHYSMEIIF